MTPDQLIEAEVSHLHLFCLLLAALSQDLRLQAQSLCDVHLRQQGLLEGVVQSLHHSANAEEHSEENSKKPSYPINFNTSCCLQV